MGIKRPHSDVDGADVGAVHPDRADRFSKASPTKKHKKTTSKGFVQKDGSFNGVKKRARTIERRLKRADDTLPADVREGMELELADLKQRIAEHDRQKRRSAMISKYHMVRFFERKKAQRLEKGLRSRLEAATDPEEIKFLKADLRIAQVDINYTKYFPFLERYVSLYAGSDDKTAMLRSKRPPMWKTVEQATREGEGALLRLQNRPPPARKTPSAESTSKVQKSGDKEQSPLEAPTQQSSKPSKEPRASVSSTADETGKRPGKEPPATGKGKTKAKTDTPAVAEPDVGDSDKSHDGASGGDFFGL